MEVRGDLDPNLALQSKRLVEVVDYWHAVRGDRLMPPRRDVDPLAIPGHLLPHLELIDVLHHPKLRFRWRQIGTHATAVVGRDQTGRDWQASEGVYLPLSDDATRVDMIFAGVQYDLR